MSFYVIVKQLIVTKQYYLLTAYPRYLSFEKKTSGLPSSIILEDKHGVAPPIHANISELMSMNRRQTGYCTMHANISE